MFAAAKARIEAIEALIDAGADASATAWVLDIPQRETEDRLQRRGDLVAPTPPLSAEARRAASASGAVARTATPVTVAGEIAGVEPPQEGAAAGYSETVGFMGGLTPLLLAVRDGHTETVLALLDRGAPLEQPSAGDQTRPLLMATLNGHFDLALLLLERGADPKPVSAAGAGPLYTTLNVEWIPKARHPQPSDYMQQRVSYLELMEALLLAGADPNERLYTELWYTTYTNDLLGVDRRGATPFWRAAHATDVPAMRLLVSYGADPAIGTRVNVSTRGGRGGPARVDGSGLPPLGPDDYGVLPIHASSGVGHGQGYAGNSHRHVLDGWLPAVRYLVEEHGADVNARDLNGYSPLHHAAARGDNEMILYLVDRGADPTVVSRRGQTTADMANGPVQRLSPFLETISLLEKLGSKNNHNCVGC
jgi:ankyrin repeat protein